MYTSIWTEVSRNNGEDAIPMVSERASAVFDGLGGSGGFIHAATGKTSAYSASRLFRKGFEKYFLKEERSLLPFQKISEGDEVEKVLQALGTNLSHFLSINNGIEMKNLGIRPEEKPRGKLMKLLPTTMAGAIFHEREEDVEIIAIWAGDSRTFVFTEKGVQQVSQDDEIPEKDGKVRDYWEFLHLGDGRISNLLVMSEPFHLNLKYLIVPKPCLVLSGSDGTFGYVREPVDLEKKWSDAFLAGETLEEARDILTEMYRQSHFDDCSMTINSFGMEDYEELKAFLEKRKETYEKEYEIPGENAIQFSNVSDECEKKQKRLLNPEGLRKEVRLPYLEQEFLRFIMEETGGIDYSQCDTVKKFLAEIEEEEQREEETLKTYHTQAQRDRLGEILKNEWITIRPALLLPLGKQCCGIMREYQKTEREYRETCENHENRLSYWREEAGKIMEELDKILSFSVEEESDGKLDKHSDRRMTQNKFAYLEKITRNCYENSAACECRKKKAGERLKELSVKFFEMDCMENPGILERAVQYYLDRKVELKGNAKEEAEFLRSEIQEKEMLAQIFREKIHNRTKERGEKAQRYWEEHKDEIYEWFLGAGIHEDTENLEEQVKTVRNRIREELAELDRQRNELEKYKGISWKTIWEAYKENYEEYLHIPSVVGDDIDPMLCYERFMKKKSGKRV